jgi:hypothetical protein
MLEANQSSATRAMHPACFARRSADRGSTGAGAPEKKAATVARDGVVLHEERGAFGQPLAAARGSSRIHMWIVGADGQIDRV